MNNNKKLRKYTTSFINVLSPYLKKGFQISATIHPATEEGAIIEFEIKKGKQKKITILKTVQKINNTLKNIDQKFIGGDIENLSFGGTNLYMEGQRILIIKGDDDHSYWSNKAVIEDVDRIMQHKGDA